MAILVVVLDVRRGDGLEASVRFSLQRVILRGGGPSTPKSSSCEFVVDVSVASCFSGLDVLALSQPLSLEERWSKLV